MGSRSVIYFRMRRVSRARVGRVMALACLLWDRASVGYLTLSI